MVNIFIQQKKKVKILDGDLRKIFRQYLPHIMWVSIESASTEAGIPDLFGCTDLGRCFWIELKACTANLIKVQPGQVAFHERYARMRGRSFVAVRFQHHDTDELLIYPGFKIRKLHLYGRSAAMPVLRCAGGPAKWSWDKVQRILSA